LKLHAAHQLLVCADFVNIERKPNTIKKHKLFAGKETDKAKYMVISRGQNARRIHIIKA